MCSTPAIAFTCSPFFYYDKWDPHVSVYFLSSSSFPVPCSIQSEAAARSGRWQAIAAAAGSSSGGRRQQQHGPRGRPARAHAGMWRRPACAGMQRRPARAHTRGCDGGRRAEEGPDRSEARACREGVEAIVGGPTDGGLPRDSPGLGDGRRDLEASLF